MGFENSFQLICADLFVVSHFENKIFQFVNLCSYLPLQELCFELDVNFLFFLVNCDRVLLVNNLYLLRLVVLFGVASVLNSFVQLKHVRSGGRLLRKGTVRLRNRLGSGNSAARR